MEKYRLYAISSELRGDDVVDVSRDEFLCELQVKGECEFCLTKNPDEADVIYIRTGGAEGRFKEIFPKINGYVRLLAKGNSNSLAASIEILSWLNQQGRGGEILHGSAEYIAQRLKERPLRLGVIGESSDWLIASNPDERALREKLNMCLVRIGIDELIVEAQKKVYDLGRWEHLNNGFNRDALEGAFYIYGAMKRIVERYELDGVTVRCFDLLKPLNNTGCLALAILNSEGIPAACEGDIPLLVSMMIAKKVTGMSGFQANPSRIDSEKDEVVFAHCTVPFDMLTGYRYDTHFESGIGVAIKGEMKEGDVTIFKMAPDLSRAFVRPATLIENLDERNLCRTQIRVKCEGIAEYLLHNPIGNHHLIVPGDVCSELQNTLETVLNA